MFEKAGKEIKEWVKNRGLKIIKTGYCRLWAGGLAFCFVYLLVQYNETEKTRQSLLRIHQSMMMEKEALNRKRELLRSEIQTLNQGPWYLDELIRDRLHLVQAGETVVLWKKLTKP